MQASIDKLLDKAIATRTALFDKQHESAFRLFNGFYEGYSDFTLDVYGRTLVIHNYAEDPSQIQSLIQETATKLQDVTDWLQAGVLKTRNGNTQDEKRGQLIFGEKPNRKVKEHNVWYAIDLMINRDASLYLDTQILRKWLIDNMKGKSVLNTFAYTGSLGVASLVGGADRVVQTDRNRRFLNLAKDSCLLNGFPIQKSDFIAQDFFPMVANFKNTKQFFDCVIIDPPFFSTTSKGRIDLAGESARIINKVRPLINDGGYLLAINNAIYLSGKEYMHTLENLCIDGYLKIEELIPVPQHFIGYNQIEHPITDPSPFNHSTKMAILQVKRK